jgi:PIN domain nuclease of toxin-antitoxin system
MTPLILDTCAVIWIANDDPIASEARVAIEETLAGAGSIYVSPMTAWEVGLLVARGRLSLSLPPTRWFARFMAQPAVSAGPLTPDMLIESSFLPGAPPNDPVDRIMIATARDVGGRLVTRDRALLSYGEQGHVQTLAC